MNDDLHKPLGRKDQTRSGGAARTLGALAVLMAGAAAGWAYWSGVFDRPQPPQEVASAAQPAAPEPARPEPASPPPAEGEAGGMADDGPVMVEAEPEGSIEPLAPEPEVKRQEPALAHLPDPDLIERTAAGALPRRSADGRRPMDAYSRQPDTEGNFGVARVVIIVGGMGISQTSSQQAIAQLPGGVTLAFAASGNSLVRWMQQARKDGHELLLQVPMEPFDYPRNDPGPHTLRVGVPGGQNIAELHWAMSRITNYVGIVNFLGARFIADQAALQPVFDELAQRGLLFVDDGTARNSASREAAAASRLPYARAHLQLDSTRTRAEIARQLEALEKEAKRTGLAIGMATAFPESIELIAEFARTAGSRGLEITPVSAIVSDPERGG